VLRFAPTQGCGQRRFTPLRQRRARVRGRRVRGRPLRASTASLPTNLERAKRCCVAPSAREGVQSHARNQNEPADLGRTDHDQPIRRRPTKADRTGACFGWASAPAAQRPRPTVRKRESPNRRALLGAGASPSRPPRPNKMKTGALLLSRTPILTRRLTPPQPNQLGLTFSARGPLGPWPFVNDTA